MDEGPARPALVDRCQACGTWIYAARPCPTCAALAAGQTRTWGPRGPARSRLRRDDRDVVVDAVDQAQQRADEVGFPGVLHPVEPAGADHPDQLLLGEREGESRLAGAVAGVRVDERPA